jgi:hypothetical protein
VLKVEGGREDLRYLVAPDVGAHVLGLLELDNGVGVVEVQGVCEPEPGVVQHADETLHDEQAGVLSNKHNFIIR